MSKTKTQLDWRDGRRRRAWELKEQGWKQIAIAAALGVSPGAVSQWLRRARS
jgi:predicted transcriptional regulator